MFIAGKNKQLKLNYRDYGHLLTQNPTNTTKPINFDQQPLTRQIPKAFTWLLPKTLSKVYIINKKSVYNK